MRSEIAPENEGVKGPAMLQIKEDTDGFVEILVSGHLSAGDFDRFEPRFEAITKRRADPVPMVIELAPDFAGWEAKALWRDLKFDVKHADDLGRIAIVGTKDWEEWGTQISDAVYPTDMRYFDVSEKQAAETWAKTGNP